MMLLLVDSLAEAGLQATWVHTQQAAPSAHEEAAPDVVVLDLDAEGMAPALLAKAWAETDSMPVVALIGSDPKAEAVAREHGLAFYRKPFDAVAVGRLLKRAAEMRFVCALNPKAALRAVGLRASGDPAQDRLTVLVNFRRVDLGMVSEALRRHALSYAWLRPEALEAVREYRILSIPEVSLARTLDGSRTLRSVCASGLVDPQGARRLMWALASIGALALGPEPPADSAAPTTVALRRVRARLHARAAWLAKAASHFDVLELPPARSYDAARVDVAVRQLAIWFYPERLKGFDLGDLDESVVANWGQVLKARQALSDPSICARHLAWLQANGVNVFAQQTAESSRPAAEDFLARGQQALSGGDAFGAVSSFAQAARLVPDDPDYEAFLAWARTMAELQRSDQPPHEVAARELATVGKLVAGRRPRPRALYALGLLAQVAGELDVARTFLLDALACDPGFTAAQRALARIPARP